MGGTDTTPTAIPFADPSQINALAIPAPVPPGPAVNGVENAVVGTPVVFSIASAACSSSGASCNEGEVCPTGKEKATRALQHEAVRVRSKQAFFEAAIKERAESVAAKEAEALEAPGDDREDL